TLSAALYGRRREQSAWRTGAVSRQHAVPDSRHQSAVDDRHLCVVGLHQADQRRYRGPLRQSRGRHARRRVAGQLAGYGVVGRSANSTGSADPLAERNCGGIDGRAGGALLGGVIPLSVLDLSPVTTATPGSAALRNSLDLARLADRLGYKRYWVAEHHNLANIASSSPEIMIGQIAAITSHLRVGSGGVMLPNHAPLMVAERFKVLEALFPGRIDLGLGRAPGTDPVTSYALRARQDPREGDDFLERFQELLLFERGGFPDGHPFRNVHAVPADVALPPIWLLGSSGYSAELAAAVGVGFAFAHHFADYDAASAMLSYREHFKPSA